MGKRGWEERGWDQESQFHFQVQAAEAQLPWNPVGGAPAPDCFLGT